MMVPLQNSSTVQDITGDNVPLGNSDTLTKKDSMEAENLKKIEGAANVHFDDRTSGPMYLVLWFIMNVVITLYCKAVFSVYKFPYPIIMTTIHLIFTYLGVQLCNAAGLFVPKALPSSHYPTILWFSVIFTANIWLSNASLMAVSVNLHQVVRTTIPLFTMIISAFVWNEKYPLTVLPSVLLVIVGVAATVKGDLDFDAFGMTIVVLGCLLSSLKGLMTQKTQVGALGLSSLDLLRYLCPLAILELLLLAFITGEFTKLSGNADLSQMMIFHLVSLGVVAFGLNFVSFRSAALLNPLTLNIAGNVKQILTSLLSIYLFGGSLTLVLLVGIIVTAIGAFWYTYEMRRWKKSKAMSSSPAETNTSPSPPVYKDLTDDVEAAELNKASNAVGVPQQKED